MSLPDHLREFSDAATARKWIFDYALEGVKNRFPIEDDNYKLELTDVHYDGPKEYSLSKQKNAILKRRKLYTPLRGTWRLIHKPTNQVLDERYDTVLQVPYLTERGTFILGGNEYAGVSQQRLKAGAYTRITNKGNPETFFNVKPGTGKNFRLYLEPETGIFKINIGQAHIPAYSLFQVMGYDDNALMKAWGPELTAINAKASSSQGVDKLYARVLGRYGNPDEPDKAKAVYEALTQFKVDPKVVARTLGVESETITPAMLLQASNKLLTASRTREGLDDRDSPVFSNVLSYEDFIKERIDNDAGRLSKSLFNKVKRDQSLARMPFAALNPYVDSYIQGSNLTSPLEETNPMSLWEQQHRLIRMGEGGISSSDSVTAEARDVNTGQLGFIDPVAGPESASIGVDTRVAYRTFKGKDRQMYGEFMNVRTGKLDYIPPDELGVRVVAFPEEDLSNPENIISAVKDGKLVRVKASEVDLQVPSAAHMFGHGVNLTPMVTGMMPGRGFYASKYWSQFMPLVKGERPLVDVSLPNSEETFMEYYGRKAGSITSPVDGIITRVAKNKLTMQGSDGKKYEYDLVQNLPYNRLTAVSYFPSVKTGDKVSAGSLLAHSNFTDKDTGSLNMGVNLHVAIMPASGHSYEDAHYISESAAKKLATERVYGYDLEARHGVTIDRREYIAMFPDKYNKDQVSKLDDRGVVKKGMILNTGDPLILATGPKVLSPEDTQLGRLHKALRTARTDKSVIWEHDYPGEVVDVDMAGKTAVVNVKAAVPLKVGDKLVTMHALKGVCGRIVPDDEMPRNSVTNEPYEILLNPMGILSRVTPNQLAVIALGKLAKQRGEQIRLPTTPPPEGWAQWTLNQLADNGVSEVSDVFDPATGATIKNIGDGYVYVSAFHHIAAHKLSDRGGGGAGAYSAATQQPAHGGFEGGQAKRFGTLDLNAALSHGATEVIRDVINIRGTKNEDYWKALKLGRTIPAPEVPFVYDKFLNLLKSGGINLSQKGDTLSLLPMTDKDIDNMSFGAITSFDMVDKNFEPVPGGLFDPRITGGLVGKRWSHIPLTQPIPNPVFEEPIRRMLGLTQRELEDTLAGTHELNGKTGGKAIHAALQSINIDAELAKHKDAATKLRGSNRDNSIKIIGYLSSLKQQEITPAQLMINKVPVLPPVFRPVSLMGDVLLQSDMNLLYRDVLETNKQIQDITAELGETSAATERLNNYNSVKAVFGLDSAITAEGRAKNLKGAIRQIIGDRPKHGLFQSKVISKPVDAVSRGVIAPDPNLDMDSIGIPEESAWELYKPFVMRRLIRRGYQPEIVLDILDKRTETAKLALAQEMEERPVLVDRAPVWHKFNLLAFKPKIVKDDDVIRLCPLVTSGFGADHDGDSILGDIFVGRVVNGELDLRITDIAKFPRILGSEHVKSSGVIEYDVPEHILVPAYKNGVISCAPVSKFSIHPNCEEWVIKTYHGRDLICSQQHSLALLDPTTLKIAKHTPAASLNKAVPILRQLNNHAPDEIEVWDTVRKYPARDVTSLPGNFMFMSDKITECLFDNWLSDHKFIYTFTSAVPDKCVLYCDDYKFASQIQLLGLRLGMDPIITTHPVPFSDLLRYTVTLQLYAKDRPEFDIVPMTPKIDKELRSVVNPSIDLTGAYITRTDFNTITDLLHDVDISDYVRKWVDLCNNQNIKWDIITSAATTGEYKTMYDITVPDAYTFVAANGMVVWDSMNFHVPVSAGAVKDAFEKMLPSKNLTSLTDLRSVRHPPSKEFVMGLYMLSRNPSRKAVKTFQTKTEAEKAYRRGEIESNDPIRILS